MLGKPCKLSGCQEKPLLIKKVCIKFEYVSKPVYCFEHSAWRAETEINILESFYYCIMAMLSIKPCKGKRLACYFNHIPEFILLAYVENLKSMYDEMNFSIANWLIIVLHDCKQDLMQSCQVALDCRYD